VLVEAHRGNSITAPENTIASIDAAAGIADLTEMDVRVTADGQLVLMHDANIRRTTDGNGAVKRQTLEELQSLDAGSWFSDDFLNEPVPTLEQAIDAAFDVGIAPLIERKAGSADLFHDEFVDWGLDESLFRVISFNRKFIDDLNILNPDYQLGILGSGAITANKLTRLVQLGADFISWRHGNVRSQATVDLVHASGLELHVWTVNDPGRMRELIDLGVDGITTDDPQTLNDLLAADLLLDSAAPATNTLAPQDSLAVRSSIVAPIPEPTCAMLLVAIPLLLARRR
jgi:glycerophosphoryl diester phosphodiesterase